MAEVTATTQSDVLDAAVQRLRSQISGLTAKNCVFSLDPEPEAALSDHFMVIVAPTGGQFPQDVVGGGTIQTCIEESGVLVTLWTRTKLDQAQRATAALTDPQRGLLTLKRKVLAALTGVQLQDPEQRAITTAALLPVSSTEPHHDQARAAYSLGIVFAVHFLWDLGA